MRLSIVSVGSWGDIQPYLALSFALQQPGFEIQYGDAGTPVTGLLHGKPGVVVPFFADQPF